MKRAKLAGALALAAAILLHPTSAVAAAQRAMRLWVSSVAPSLFPFLVLMPTLTGAEASAVYEAMFSKIMKPLFHLPGQAASAVVIGMIAGSPAGAIATRRIAAQSHMEQGECRRIALAVSGVSPAFLMMGVGKGMYGSGALGAKLAIAQMATQLLLLFLLRSCFSEEKEEIPYQEDLFGKNSVGMAAESAIGICGYMVFFSIIGAVVTDRIGAQAGRCVLLAVDLPSGLAELAHVQSRVVHFLLGAAVGFGGVCIGMQNLDALRETGMCGRDYFAARIMASALMGVICMLILPNAELNLKESLENPAVSHAFSILIAIFLAIPPLIHFSKKCFLNNEKSESDNGKMAKNSNM